MAPISSVVFSPSTSILKASLEMHVQRQMKAHVNKIEPQIRKPASPSGSSIGASGIDPVSSSDDSASLPPYQPQVLQPHVLEPQEQKSQSVSGAFNIYHRIAQAEELKKKYFPGFGQTGTPVTVGGHGYNHFPIGNHKIERNFDEDDEEIDVDA